MKWLFFVCKKRVLECIQNETRCSWSYSMVQGNGCLMVLFAWKCWQMILKPVDCIKALNVTILPLRYEDDNRKLIVQHPCWGWIETLRKDLWTYRWDSADGWAGNGAVEENGRRYGVRKVETQLVKLVRDEKGDVLEI